MKQYRLEQAEKNIFAVHQVIYSNSDIEMWYDWNTRLDDTKFTDQCFWIMCDNDRIGGVVKINDTLMFPFIIPPFSDRQLMWRILLNCCEEIRNINGVLQDDGNILLSSGFKVNVIRQVMCCPTDASKKPVITNGFSLYMLDDSFDITKIKEVMKEGYRGGIDYEIFGVPNDEKIMEDLSYLLQVYKHRNLSIHVVNEQNQEIVGLCIAGISENMPLGFAEIGELCIVPQYRNKGIAEFMLNYIKKSASDYTEVVKLCVTVGNYAEILYKKAGFQAGPRFARMTKRSM
ncbi:Ribosomal protein S18 acetylase RimI [Fontibacillus panacisegetis]|uniref:Ribosomal protein S18 acetylase RimI n=1 Tax=Fontibacillus panacisegetis TaxID=670482 RepID=A0A1G7EQ68_9BACL|nr:GNAT family N-acetyltransferase [Fontibacillus panacisegetis]SDE65545.1 Ribosomal protein S18 acetylase RimI [Fontibacillus panacisegetis]